MYIFRNNMSVSISGSNNKEVSIDQLFYVNCTFLDDLIGQTFLAEIISTKVSA